MGDEMEYWYDIKRVYTDCRLDTFYNLLNYYGNRYTKEEYFLLCMPMEEHVINLVINIQKTNIKCPIIECVSNQYLERLLSYTGLRMKEYVFNNIDQEITFLKCRVNRNPIIVELIGSYLDPYVPRENKNTVFGSVSTVSIVQYNEKSNEFIIGIKDVMTDKLIRISIDDYKNARYKKFYPFPPSDKLHELIESGSTPEFDLKAECKNNFKKQVENLHNKKAFEVLGHSLKEEIVNHNGIIDESIYEMYDTQCNILFSSLILGSTTFFYYDLADAGTEFGLVGEEQSRKLRDIGVSIKKMIREFKIQKDNMGFQSIINLSQKLLDNSKLKRDILHDILASLNTKELIK